MQLRTVLNAIKNHSQCNWDSVLPATNNHSQWDRDSFSLQMIIIRTHSHALDNFTTLWQFCNTIVLRDYNSVTILQHLFCSPFVPLLFSPLGTSENKPWTKQERDIIATLLLQICHNCCKFVTIVTPPVWITSMLSFTFIFGGVKILFDIIV